MLSRRAKAWGLVGALVAVIALSVLAAPYKQKCYTREDGNTKDCAAYNVVLIFVREIGEFLDEHNGAVAAVVAVVVAYFTFELLRSTKKMQEVTAATLDHLRKEFLAAHRPRLIVRRIIFSGSVEEDISVDVHIEIANIGESDARITKFAVTPKPNMVTHPKPAEIVKLIEEGLRPVPEENRLVGAGDSLVIVVPITDTIAHALGVNRVQKGLYRLYCVGYVEYTNAIGEHKRRTGFIRCGNLDTEYFQGVKGLPDFEYAD